MHLAEAGAADAPELVRLINAAYRPTGPSPGWTNERALLAGPRIDEAAVLDQLRAGRFLLLRRDGQPGSPILACAHLAAEPDAACYLSLIAVHPAHQAAGLGAALLQAAEQDAARTGSSRLRITVITQREALVAWYERRGFTRTGAALPFPYGDPAVGRPLRPDLQLVVLEKPVASQPP